jgi:hypothetical protein
MGMRYADLDPILEELAREGRIGIGAGNMINLKRQIAKIMPPKASNQLVGNTGLFYVCYELSKRGWNCLPTSRNAKGPDLVIYSQNAEKKNAVQVKTLSRRNPVPFGTSPNLIADFLIVCVLQDVPEVYVLTKKEALKPLHKGEREGRISYWLQPSSYEEHKDCWHKIGDGFDIKG